MQRFSPLFLSIVLAASAALSPVASASVVWFGDQAGLHQIDAVTNQIVADIAFEPPVAIAVNAGDGSVWVLTQSRLARFSQHGSVLLDISSRTFGNGLGSPRLLALNPNDGSVWAAFENRVVHVDGEGVVRHVVDAAAEDLAIAQDGGVWMLTQSSLQKLDASGAVAVRVASAAGGKGMKFLALDDAGGAIWLAGEKDVAKVSSADPGQTLLSFVASQTVAGLSVDPQSGNLWLLGQNSLFAFDRDATPLVSRDLRDFSIANSRTVVFDFGTQGVWIGHQHGLSRLTPAGTLAASFPATPAVDSIAVGRAPVDITPVVTIVSPASGALVNDPTPLLRVEYDALCGATSCGFPNAFFASFSLAAQLNGTEIGSSFAFEPATGTASFIPALPLPEGLNVFSAQARDPFGGESGVVTVSFTIDSIAPTFRDVTPPSGSLFTSAPITIRGSVDDPAASVTLGAQSQGQSFNFPITLNAGTNHFTLVARDPAGNTTSFPLTYTYEPPNVPPTVRITGPTNNANFTAPANVVVTAEAADSDGSVVRVEFFSNGQPAGFDTSAPYSVTLSNLPAGSYSLTARAFDNRNGETASDPVNIIVGPPNALPLVRIISPTTGTSFSAPATVPLAATASDPDGTVAKVEFFLNGAPAATVTTGTPEYLATLTGVPAGNHLLIARATDNRGGTSLSVGVTITVAATSLIITSPAPNATVAGDAVLVTGRYTGLANGGVTVNNVIAAVDAFRNFSVIVPVSAGANTLTARLVTVDGTAITQAVSVNSTGVTSPYAVIPTPSTGLAPLLVKVVLSNPTAASTTLTIDGGSPFTLPAGASAQFTNTYPAGVWVNTIVFTDPSGARFEHRIVTDSRDPVHMDQMFRAIWNGLNNALVAGDKEGAMRYLDGSAKRKFGPVFDALLPSMPAIVASYSTLAQSSITNSIGEYAVRRMDEGQNRLFLIYFMLDVDGVWRIDDM